MAIYVFLIKAYRAVCWAWNHVSMKELDKIKRSYFLWVITAYLNV